MIPTFKLTGLRAALAAGLVLCGGVVAQAQDTTAGQPGTAQHTPSAPGGAPIASSAVKPPEAPARTAAQVDQQIARLRRELKITTAQGPAWDAFAAVMRDNAAHMDQLYEQRSIGLDTMSAPDTLHSYIQLTQAHLEDLQKLEPAFATLYGTMTDAQKKSADTLFRHDQSARRGSSTPAE